MKRELVFTILPACVVFLGVSGLLAEPELVRAFAFGARDLDCGLDSQPGSSYTMVLHSGSDGTAADALEYSAGRGWGYVVTRPGEAGFGRFGPFDDTPNTRDAFGDACPEELYDSGIGAKDFATPCLTGEDCEPPEGIIFRVDVPNGRYRFVAAVGDSQFPHSHRLVVEDGGGSNGPEAIGANRVVLVQSFDQGEHGPGVFARVGFDGRLPPDAAVAGFLNMDAAGLESSGAPESPTIEVTQGHVRIHQLQGATTAGDGNGGDLVVLELWRVDETFTAVERGATWSYLPGDAEASLPDRGAWRLPEFDDSSWATGAAPVGYGEAGIVTDLALLNPPMQNNYTTLFLRRTFELSNPSAVTLLRASVDYDDGFVMWINGEEVLRINVDGFPGDPVFFDDLSTTGHESGLFEEFDLPEPPDYLVAGTNVVAVQVFNTSITSSDLKYDLELMDPFAPDLSPPQINQIVPAPGATLRSLSQIDVRFDEPVIGVDAADLLVNGLPATGVTGQEAGPYVFTFAEPAVGTVEVTWRPTHDIRDLMEPPNFFPGGSWSYMLDPDAPVAQIVIGEILAVNRSGMVDEDGERVDWFEIVNVGSEAVNLFGYSATDDADDKGRWTFPAVTLGPQEYLVVAASGKDRKPTDGGLLHTNFSFSSTGEYFGIYSNESPRELVAEMAPRFPKQRADVSYGLDGTGSLVYFETPTPGAANTGSVTFDGFVLEPIITPERGFFDAPIAVTLATRTPGASIRYTLDGSEPTPSSGTLYQNPIPIQGGPDLGLARIRAVAYRSGFLSSDVVTHSYVFVDDVMEQPDDPTGFPGTWGSSQPADYAMDPRVVNDPGHRDLVREGLRSIPTLSIVMDTDDAFSRSTGFYANPSREGIAWERPVSAELIYPDGRDGFQINCGIRAQGGSSTSNWKAHKISMRLLFKGEYGEPKLDFPLFPDSAVTRFNTLVLDAHLNQTWNHPSHSQRVRAQYLRDTYVSDLQNSMGGHAPHDVFVNLYLNGLYWGVYDVHERPDAAFAEEYFGGDESEYDVLRHTSSTVVDGSSAAWNTAISLSRQDLSQNANYLALQDYVDVPDLIDYMLANLWAGNDDWAHHNWYVTRRRVPGAGFRVHSWDAEHVLKDVNINRIGVNNSGSPAEIYTQLRANEDFRLLFADHVHRHFFNGGTLYVDPANPDWDPAHPERNVPAALYTLRVSEIDPAIACEAARWGDTYRPSEPYTRNDEWAAELAWIMDQYMPVRSSRVLGQLQSAGLYPTVGAPIFNRQGGRIDPGFVLTMSRPSGTGGTIYYTVDGSDPRLAVSGTLSPSAETYDGPLILQDRTRVRARILSANTWSAMNEATFTLADPVGSIRFTELMYNPPATWEFEFIELENLADATVDMTGVRFTDGVDFVFPDHFTVPPGGKIVLVASAGAFEALYPGVPFHGVYVGRLDDGGERVTVETEDGARIDSVSYDDEGFWPISPDGFGHSLVLASPAGDADSPESWRASAMPGGSPAELDPPALHGGIVVHEVLAHASTPLESAIELHNPTAGGIDIGGWYLSNDRTDEGSLRRYRIPDGLLIGAGEYLVFYEADFAPGGFLLDPRGGDVYLSSADASGALTGYITSAAYEAAPSGVSFGRLRTSTSLAFSAMDERTFGADFPATVKEFRTGGGLANAGPLFGPVVINEIHYHPPAGELEFLELFNPTGSDVPLHDPGLGRGWRIRGILDSMELDAFEFDAGTVVPARGYLLVVPIAPALFRGLYAIPSTVPIEGPFGGGVDNSGERLKLMQPLAPIGEVTPYTTVDEVRYNDLPPWPTSADGSGFSLERIVATSYGDDVANWAPSLRLGGTPGVENTASSGGGNRPPRALFAATPGTGFAPLQVFFDASQSFDLDGSIASFSWDFDDGNGASGRTVLHTFVSPGSYNVRLVVVDDGGLDDAASLLVNVTVDPGGGQVPGDSNQDGFLDIGDAISLLFRIYRGLPATLPCEGTSPEDGGNAVVFDLNDDLRVDISDPILLLTYLFLSGSPPTQGAQCRPVPGCQDVCDFR